MQTDFWFERWEKGEIGFHEGRPNAFLEAHVGRLAGRKRILVPLCGKAVDLRFLADHGHEVVGIELVEAGARAFFEEQGLVVEESRKGPFLVLASGAIQIFVGSVFDATEEYLGTFDGVYDRAAVVALPPEPRARYAKTVRALLREGGAIFAVTFTYGDERTEVGPPFSVPKEALEKLYPAGTLETIDTRSFPTSERLRSLGVETMTESAFWLVFGAREEA